MEVTLNEISIKFEDGLYQIKKDNYIWQQVQDHQEIQLQNGRSIAFNSAKQIRSQVYQSGSGKGIHVMYRDFLGVNFAFDTIVWIEEVSGHIYFEWIPLNEHGYAVKEIGWPQPFECEKTTGYSLIPYMQGVLLPHTYECDWDQVLPFHGQLCSSAAYMPWLAQVEDKHGYLMVNETPWDARYEVKHKACECGTRLSMWMLPSLGKMQYKRVLRFTFFQDCDYNTICKEYRKYAIETGMFSSLKEKRARNQNVDKLIGSAFIHMKVKTLVREDSSFYNRDNPLKNNHITSFDEVITKVKQVYDLGVDKVYLHLDGWGQQGYDNGHPDCLPACQEAGGWEGLRRLSDYLVKQKGMLGLHDQYRDYYHHAASYNRRFSLQDVNGDFTTHAHWAGGAQDYLCASLAKQYVKRNFETVLSQGIHLEASYLDVFTCNELDECHNPLHKMSRQQCAFHREACFHYVWSKQILPSSEEVNAWAMRSLVFAHYAPYEFMLKKVGTQKVGIPVPLFNLVYHDAIIIPWPMKKYQQEDYMLYALLNGGAAYVTCEGAYANVDGAFNEGQLSLEECISRYQIVAAFQKEVAYEEMLRHTFIDDMYEQQEVVFANGKTVYINTKTQEYTIK